MAGTKLDPVDLLTEPVQVTGRLLQRPRVPPPRPWADLEDPSEGSSSPTPSTTSSVPSSPSSVDSPLPSRPGRKKQKTVRMNALQRDQVCPVSGMAFEGRLEAAHIVPHAKHCDETWIQDPANIVLLERNLHLYFDRKWISFVSTANGVVLRVTDNKKGLKDDLVTNYLLCPGQVLPNFPKECLVYLHLRNYCDKTTIKEVHRLREILTAPAKPWRPPQEQLDRVEEFLLRSRYTYDGPTPQELFAMVTEAPCLDALRASMPKEHLELLATTFFCLTGQDVGVLAQAREKMDKLIRVDLMDAATRECYRTWCPA